MHWRGGGVSNERERMGLSLGFVGVRDTGLSVLSD
jgi:hypothetical protein